MFNEFHLKSLFLFKKLQGSNLSHHFQIPCPFSKNFNAIVVFQYVNVNSVSDSDNNIDSVNNGKSDNDNKNKNVNSILVGWGQCA